MTKKILIILLIFIFLGFFFLNNPEVSGWYITCPFKLMTGYDCPGCGSQRALHELLHLNFRKAFFLNPFLFIAGLYIVFGLIIRLKFFKAYFPKLSQNIFGIKAIIFGFILTLLFFIFRNTEWYLDWVKYYLD